MQRHNTKRNLLLNSPTTMRPDATEDNYIAIKKERAKEVVIIKIEDIESILTSELTEPQQQGFRITYSMRSGKEYTETFDKHDKKTNEELFKKRITIFLFKLGILETDRFTL